MRTRASLPASASVNVCMPPANEKLAATFLAFSAFFLRSRAPAIWPRIRLPYFCSSAWSRGNAAGTEIRSGSPAYMPATKGSIA